MTQIIPYLILLSQHLDTISFDTTWINSVNLQLIQLLQLLQLQEKSDTVSEELKSLENAWLRKLIIKLIQLLTGQCLHFPLTPEKDSAPPYGPYKDLSVDAPPVIETYQFFKSQKQLDYQQIMKQYQLDKGRPMKPISSNKERKLNYQGRCPHSQTFKLRYIYRAFDLELPQLAKEVREKLKTPIDLANIRNSKHILGLVLTYYVNYGLSSRKTAAIMHDVHQIKSLMWKIILMSSHKN